MPASAIRLLQLTVFVSTLDRFAMPPVLIAIAHDLGVPLSDVVPAAGAYFLFYGLTQPVWGTVSDALGLVRTIRLAMLAAAVCTTAAAFAWTPLALGLTRGLAGGFFGAAYPGGLVYVGDTVPAEGRQREVARLMVGLAVGTALASVGAGLVATVFTWRAAFVATGLAALALAFVLGRLVEPPRSRGAGLLRPVAMIARSRAATFVLLLAFLEGAVLLGGLTLLPAAVEAAGASATVAGAVTGTFGLAVFGAANAVGRVSARLAPARLIAAGATAELLACAAISVSRSPAVGLLAAVLIGVAWAAMHSTLQTWATEVLPDARATMVSLFAGALFGGSATAALLVADLVAAGRYGMIFAGAGALTVPLGLLATAGRARWRGP
ncbi:MAG TPA: MFS transporter [Actinophytocola sp.]|uniref:MFS transporter n=1 Tax=Actinophytocola sp. TaxID=1872138 RepID=UPI002DDD0E44|nr:MFS transporter [Actinophytocola sp.]HEV2784622.1 MFS transporter [Actinophytocola sp.]